jgi:2-haloalkanoic acid dehalogenase type II
VVTFDLFSALVDSRRGGSAAFASLGEGRGWAVAAVEVYDAWDRHNKAAHRAVSGWLPFAQLAAHALAEAYATLDLDGDPVRDIDSVLATVGHWPLWPDVAAEMPVLAERYRIGLLSNVDDTLFAQTRAAPYVDPELAMTSERLGVYKPDPGIYLGADAAVGPIVHVAASARDVRGALEAGIPTVRLIRPGHHLDPEGPRPPYEVSSTAELPPCIDQAARDRTCRDPGHRGA